MDIQRLEGTVVACTATAYGSFKDRETGEVIAGGETLRVWLSTSFEADPVAVRLRAGERNTWESMRQAGPGVVVALSVELKVNYMKQIERYMVSVEQVTAVGKAAARGASTVA